MIKLLFSFFFILMCSFHGISSSVEIAHCDITEHLEEHVLCVLCERGYYLNQSATSCALANHPNQLNNCLQISFFGECMRCHCGYVLEEETNLCVPATSNSLLGCEVLKGNSNNVCLRPRQDFQILRSDAELDSTVEFSRGSNCEIRNSRTGRCMQCHSGYKLQEQLHHIYVCEKTKSKIMNQFFSYFDVSGNLRSRHYQFTVVEGDENQGVHPIISNCQKYKSAEITGNYYCAKCFIGKVLNQSKTQCLRSPIALCGLVSDDDTNLCLECEDNQNFYLFTDPDSKQQKCLPRLLAEDPTDACLEYFKDFPGCKQCITGQIPAFTGCILAGMKNTEEWASSEITSGESGELVAQTQRRLVDSSCIIWEGTKEQEDSQDTSLIRKRRSKCLVCRQSMIINEIGMCTRQSDQNCLIARQNGGCLQCIPLMFYSEFLFRCIFIKDIELCYTSSGIEDTCQEQFVKEISPNQEDNSNFLNACVLFRDRSIECIQCYNLFYIDALTKYCKEMTQATGCLYSDGITNFCLKCKKTFRLDGNGVCIEQTVPVKGQCVQPNFYYDPDSDKCLEYSFEGYKYCFRYDYNKNECLECKSGSFLGGNGVCMLVEGCTITDGFTNKCYLAKKPYNYIDEYGVPQQTKEGCKTNQQNKQCGNCVLPDGAQGISLNDDECVSRLEISAEIVRGCFHLKTNNGEGNFHCDLCFNRNSPDTEGICRHLQDLNCLISNGRSEACLLCIKEHFYNDQTKSCQPSLNLSHPPRLCEIWSENICLQCKNLFYLHEDKSCKPIHDPDCEESDGIHNICNMCVDNIKNSLVKEYCIPKFCQEIEKNTGHCAKCFEGYDLIKPPVMEYNQNANHSFCTKVNNSHCIQIDVTLHCLQCEEGYFLTQQSSQTKFTCLKIPILNCLEIEFFFYLCTRCQEGYTLDHSHHYCWPAVGCKKQFKDACIQCKEDYYLDEGFCVKIVHCQVQTNRICKQCDSGYYVHYNDQAELTFDYRNTVFQQENSVHGHYECIKIQNCQESHGIHESCLKCADGFSVLQGICVRKNFTNIINFCASYDANENCIQCKNLFFLENGVCRNFNEDSHCQISDGISKNCQLCSFHGFSLDTDKITCQMISDCILSDGIAFCVKCTQGYIVNSSGVCEKLLVSLDHCKVFSYAKVNPFTYLAIDDSYSMNFYQDVLETFPKLEIINSKTNEHVRFNDMRRVQNNKIIQDDKYKYLEEFNKDSTTRIKCIQCESLYAFTLSQTQPCASLNQQSTSNCVFSEGINSICSVCQSEMILKYDEKNQNQISCKLGKRILNYDNRGCQLFARNNDCVKCLSGFYWRANKFVCYPRNPLSKCLRFNPNKNECQTCRSGYILESIHLNNGDTGVFCMKLDVSQQVENCEQYKSNTNVCLKCVKKLKLDVVEFVLRESTNKCEDVLGLMCKEMNHDSTGCLISFIENCEKYALNSLALSITNCVACKNGFYLFANKTSCVPHGILEDCQIYSQLIPDTCELCKDLFFLDRLSKCQRNSIENCRIQQEKSDVCLRCYDMQAKKQFNFRQIESILRFFQRKKDIFSLMFDRFVVDQDTGSCVRSAILNCIEVKVLQVPGEKDSQKCHKCEDNFIVEENNPTKCILRMIDYNCEVLTSQRVCVKCKNSYFLTAQGECISTATHLCSAVSNCKSIDILSSPVSLLCEECEDNYKLDGNQKCQQFLDYSTNGDDTDEITTGKQLDLDKNREENTQSKRRITDDSVLMFMIGVGVVLVVVGGIIFFVKRKIQGSSSKAELQDAEEEEAKEGENQKVFQGSAQQIELDIQMSQLQQQQSSDYDYSHAQPTVILENKQQIQQFDFL